jgi:putative Mg2+ transporter-C (MgtC) family protein
MSDLEAIGLIALAGLLGGVLGFEREIREKAAGVRTHMLVSTAAAAIVVLGRVINDQAVADGQSAGDPTRALHAVITGIGFIGAGAIMVRTSEREPRGLTTATSLFFAATVGIAVGIEELAIAAAMTALALIALAGLPFVMRTLMRNK